MKSFWKYDGKPGADGRLCFVTDLEDGTNPINTYGHTQEEVLAKIARTNAHAQLAIARTKIPPANGNAATGPATAPKPAPSKVLTPDETMKATADLNNPATASTAVVKLFESATGLDVQKIVLNNFQQTGEAWEAEHPDFYPHPGNRKLVADAAIRMAGGMARVTKEILTHVFTQLFEGGYLIEDPQSSTQITPAVPPEENPAASTARPRTLFATGHRSTRLRSAQTVPTRTLKYTPEQIRTMSEAESRRLIASNDKDYAEACEAYFGSGAQATA